MLRGPLYRDDYRPQFSGHETFPLRYGWLKKAFDEVHGAQKDILKEDKSVFLAEDAVARFGVGKNMVASIRHWAEVSGIIEEGSKGSPGRVTELGCRLFAKKGGRDKYTENPATSWLVHWNLCTNPKKATTWFWAFSHYPSTSFERDLLVSGLRKLAADRKWKRASPSTIKSDVACFVRTYAPQSPSKHGGHEDALESPLTELGLIKAVGKRDGFRFVRGRKQFLGRGVFCYAITKFWLEYFPAQQTLSFESILHGPGSPGRVFLLDEADLVGRLMELEEVSGGLYRWSETAGLKQLTRNRDLDEQVAFEFIGMDYGDGGLPDAH